MEILDHFGIDLTGKKVVVVSRNPVVGNRSHHVAEERNITVCHTKTKDMASVVKEADVVMPVPPELQAFRRRVVIDVGINFDEATEGDDCAGAIARL